MPPKQEFFKGTKTGWYRPAEGSLDILRLRRILWWERSIETETETSRALVALT